MKIGISWNCYKPLSQEEQIKLMKENGFEATFVSNEYENFDSDVQALQKAGIAVETIHAPFRPINDIWEEGEKGDAMLKRLTDCAADAARHNIPVIVVHLSSGTTPPMISDAGNRRFAKLMEEAKRLGITVAFENQRKLANLALMFEYYEEARFCWDVGHEKCFAAGREYMPLFGDKLTALHIHDNSCLPNQDLHMIPYDGNIDFEHVAKQIAKSGYQGTVMLEMNRSISDRYIKTSPEEYYTRAATAAKRLRDRIEFYKEK